MKSRSLWILLTLTLLASLITACGGEAATSTVVTAPTATTGSGTAPTNTTEAAMPTSVPTPTVGMVTLGSGSVKLEWWHISTALDQRANWEKLANEFIAANPNVSIEITVLENEAFKSKLATAMQSGNPPDVFQSWGGGVLGQYGAAGLVQDLTPELAKDGWGDSFQPGPLSLYRINDRVYGVPWNAGMVGFWYNKDLFTKAGIAAPPATWTELLDAVRKLKAAGITPIAVGEKDKWPGHFYWVYLATRIGGREAFEAAYARTGSFADEPFVEAGARLKELVDLQPFQTGFLGAGYGDQQVLMANGEAAMELMGQWAPGANRAVATDVETYNKNLGFFPFPTVDGGAGDASDVLGGGDGFAIGKNAPPEAIALIRFLTSVKNQTDMTAAGLSVPPVVKGAETALTDPLIAEVQQRAGAAKYYQLYYDQYLPPAVGGVVNDEVQALFAGTSTPEEVAQAIEESAATELSQ